MAWGNGAPEAYAQLVLDVVETIPPGFVLSYGDVASLVSARLGRPTGGPRQVGRVLAEWGGDVPWWRVVRADGSPAPSVAARALRLLASEHAPLTAGGSRVDVRRARWRPQPAEE